MQPLIAFRSIFLTLSSIYLLLLKSCNYSDVSILLLVFVFQHYNKNDISMKLDSIYDSDFYWLHEILFSGCTIIYLPTSIVGPIHCLQFFSSFIEV